MGMVIWVDILGDVDWEVEIDVNGKIDEVGL